MVAKARGWVNAMRKLGGVIQSNSSERCRQETSVLCCFAWFKDTLIWEKANGNKLWSWPDLMVTKLTDGADLASAADMADAESWSLPLHYTATSNLHNQRVKLCGITPQVQYWNGFFNLTNYTKFRFLFVSGLWFYECRHIDQDEHQQELLAESAVLLFILS